MEDYHTSRGSGDRYLVESVDDSGDVQYRKVSGLTDEIFEKVMVIFPHGFTSHPVKEAHQIGMSIGGRRDTTYLLGGEHPKHRPKNIGEGNTAIYNADGTIMKLVGRNWTMDAEGTLTVTVKKVVFKCDKFSVICDDINLGEETVVPKVITDAGPSPYVKAKV